jgi:hypothetical protein
MHLPLALRAHAVCSPTAESGPGVDLVARLSVEEGVVETAAVLFGGEVLDCPSEIRTIHVERLPSTRPEDAVVPIAIGGQALDPVDAVLTGHLEEHLGSRPQVAARLMEDGASPPEAVVADARRRVGEEEVGRAVEILEDLRLFIREGLEQVGADEHRALGDPVDLRVPASSRDIGLLQLEPDDQFDSWQRCSGDSEDAGTRTPVDPASSDEVGMLVEGLETQATRRGDAEFAGSRSDAKGDAAVGSRKLEWIGHGPRLSVQPD